MAHERNDKPLDSSIEIVTPENISFRYRVAGPFRRVPAFLIDLLLRIGVWCAIWFVLGLVGVFSLLDPGFLIALMLILLFIMEWLYGGVLETYWNGQTVGKRVMGIRVISDDGQPIIGLQAMMRNILRFVDIMPFASLQALFGAEAPIPIPMFLVGFLTPLLNPRFQRLGDLVCGTMVVIDEKPYLIETALTDDPRVAQLAAELPPNFVVSRTLAKALASYVDRRRLFAPARRREIARHVAEPLIAKFKLPPDTSYDLLLCALYHRTYVAMMNDDVVLPESRAATHPLTAVPVS